LGGGVPESRCFTFDIRYLFNDLGRHCRKFMTHRLARRFKKKLEKAKGMVVLAFGTTAFGDERQQADSR